MALWLVRGGKHGEYEQRFLDEGRVYLTWDTLNADLAKLDWDALVSLMKETYPEAKQATITNWASQVYPFAHDMKKGDWIVLPRKGRSLIAVGEITGDYQHHPDGKDPFFHTREVKWLKTDVQRSAFDVELLYSFGAFMTICRIKRNDAEARVRAMPAKGWKTAGTPKVALAKDPAEAAEAAAPETIDIAEIARDSIANLIISRFKGHGMARLVEAILKAQGYVTFRSPEGPDKGVDILAAGGPLGFGEPRICVQVKSSDDPVDLPTVSQLRGTMERVRADHGLFVSWGDFKSSVEKDTAEQFFKVRLWNRERLIEELLAVYDKLDPDLQSELPLKRIWTVMADESTEGS
jgi:restriction system protein